MDKPDGSHWIMFDKGAQRLKLDVGEKHVNVFNLHYFPFQHFRRRMNENEFSDSRQKLVDILLSENRIPTIVTGDFNNKGLPLNKAFPELFMRDRFTEAVSTETTVIGLCEQFDHILYTPNTLEAYHGFADMNLSDHYAVGADFSFIH